MSRVEIDLADGDVADGSIQWLRVTGNEGLTFGGVLTSGSATMALKEQVAGAAVGTLDAEGAALNYTASFKELYKYREGDIVGLSVSGTSSAVGTVYLCGRFVAV
jgi:hypothetical protein